MTISRDPTKNFVEKVRRWFDRRNLDTFWNCETGLRSLVQHGVIEDWINLELRRLNSDVHYLGDWLPNEVVLYRDADCALSIALLETPQRYIHALPFLAMYVPLRVDLLIDRYELPEAYRNEVFDPSLRLKQVATNKVSIGEVLRIDSGRFAYDLRISEPLVLLRFVSSAIRPLEWLFTKSSLQAWQANDAELSFTQLRVAANVLGKISHQSSIGPLRQLARHPHHAVRWAAIQNLGRLNRSEALLMIREAIHDPHPHVRRAALKTLDRLEGRTKTD